MAKAIIAGLLSSGLSPARLYASAASDKTRTDVAKRFGIASGSNSDACDGADVIVLAVKPQRLEHVCVEIQPHIKPNTLIISVAAGIDCASIETWLGDHAIVRCMPNTPSSIGMGAAGLFANHSVTEQQKQTAQRILEAVGVAMYVDSEPLIDAVTAVSGSGPAYFFLFIEAMADAGEQLGLSREVASALAKQTALGASSLAKQSETDIQQLRKNVTSPKGTTEQAIMSFEKNDLRGLVTQAMQACASRAKSLSNELGAN